MIIKLTQKYSGHYSDNLPVLVNMSNVAFIREEQVSVNLKYDRTDTVLQFTYKYNLRVKESLIEIALLLNQPHLNIEK